MYRSFLCVFFLMFWGFLEAGEASKRTVLVVGGAGYIGSHVNEMLHREGYETVVFDNLQTGHRDAVLHGTFVKGDIGDTDCLEELFSSYHFDAVMHFAALKDVGESTLHPLKYYQNNVSATLNLLDVMLRHHVNVFIFSSSATIFGEPVEYYMDENHPCHPINPYGQSKLMIETILEDLDRANKLRYCCLRYFNAAGGDPRGEIKNNNRIETNLIPLVLRNLLDHHPTVTIYGTDYPTPDGTCIRDYVHIEDLGRAHIAVMEKIFNGADSTCYNLGNRRGYSVKEVLATIEKVTDQKLTIVEEKRREGDSPTLVACSKKAQQELGWSPRYSSLETIIEHAWNAMQKSL